jgi:hypothetical protein
VYDTPEDTGLRPDGDAAPRTPTFYLLTAGWLAISMLVTTPAPAHADRGSG